MTGQMHLGNKLAYEVKQLYTKPPMSTIPPPSPIRIPRIRRKKKFFGLSFLIFLPPFFFVLSLLVLKRKSLVDQRRSRGNLFIFYFHSLGIWFYMRVPFYLSR